MEMATLQLWPRPFIATSWSCTATSGTKPCSPARMGRSWRPATSLLTTQRSQRSCQPVPRTLRPSSLATMAAAVTSALGRKGGQVHSICRFLLRALSMVRSTHFLPKRETNLSKQNTARGNLTYSSSSAGHRQAAAETVQGARQPACNPGAEPRVQQLASATAQSESTTKPAAPEPRSPLTAAAVAGIVTQLFCISLLSDLRDASWVID